MSWLQKSLAWILPGQAMSTETGANFERNVITVAAYSDWLDRMGGASPLGLSTTWACVNLLAGTIASLPLVVYQDRSGRREVAKQHPLYRVLHDSPNADQTALDFWEYICASIELRGNAYAEIERGVRGQVIALHPLRPENVRARRIDDGSIGYDVSESRRQRRLRQEDIFHVRGFGGDALGGLSTLSACAGAFGGAAALEAAASGMFANGVRPSGVLSTDKVLSAEQRNVAERLLQEKFAGAMNSGRPMLLDNGLAWHQLTINPEDAQMLESRGFSVEEICRIFGVPPHMVGHTAGNTQLGSSITEQTRGFEKFTLRRRVKRIEQSAMKQLLTPADQAAGVAIEFNMEGLLRGSTEERAAFYESALKNKWRTINEVRSLENEAPVPWGDRPWGQQQDIQLQEDGSVPPADTPSSSENEE